MKKLNKDLQFGLALCSFIIVGILFFYFVSKKDNARNNIFSSSETINAIKQQTSPLIFWCHLNRKVLNLSKYAEVNAPVTLWNLIDEDKTQLWTIERKGNDFVIRSCQHQRVLAIHPNDSSIVQQDFEGKASQLWSFTGNNDSIRIINKATDKCLAFIKDSLKIVDRSKYRDQLWKIQTPQSFEKDKVTCNCVENYEFVKAWIESSYPGFANKVNSTTKFQYDSLCNELAAKVKKEESISMCHALICKYIEFFKDNHLQFYLVYGVAPIKPFSKALPGANWFSFSDVDDSTLLFSLPDFHEDNRNKINYLINLHKRKILKTPYLIIDVRNNGGGTDRGWENIIPYIYTNPIKMTGNDLLASDELIREYSELYHWDKSFQAQRNSLIEEQKKKPDKFVLRCKDNVLELNSVMPNPKRVVILSNENNGSSGEAFLLSAKQSKKVIIMGQPSKGVLDYSNVISIQCPSFAFQLQCPTTRASWVPEYSVDKEKIKPDIYLEYNQDWIKEAIKALKSNFGHQHSSQ